MIKYFCMPTDFKKETIDAYDELNRTYKDAKVIETYGNITKAQYIGSGRAANQLPASDLLDLKLFIQYSRKKNIDFNYTLNATHLQNKEFTREGITEIITFLRNLHDVGVRSVTVALPSLIEIIQTSQLDFKIKSSTLCQITNVNKAVAYKNKGIERIVVDESINRDFATLHRIREAFGDKVEMIINPICLKDCTYRMFHYNEITMDSVGKTKNTAVNYYEHRCVLQRNSKISNLLRMCFVRPEDIIYYTDIGIHHFKLQGRHLVLKGDAVKTLKAYFDQQFDGDLMDLIYMFFSQNSFRLDFDNKKLEGFIKPFVQKEGFCKRDCEKCNYCENFAKRIINYNRAEEIVQAAEEFYKEFDEFNLMIRSENSHKSNDNNHMDFDFQLT